MGDSLFTIDVVRDFMISKSGKVTNHDLVTHFKRFLNDPSNKVTNRERFKEFVNTLATVKLDDRGEKVLVLKKKYRDGAPLSGPVDIQERGPKHELHRPKAKIRKQEPEPPPEPEASTPAVPQPSGAIAAAAAAFETAETDEVFLPTGRHVPEAALPMEQGRLTPDREPEQDSQLEQTSEAEQSVEDDYGDRPLILPSDLSTQDTSAEPVMLGSPIGESTTDEIFEVPETPLPPPPAEAPPPPPPATPPPIPPSTIELDSPPEGESSTDSPAAPPATESPDAPVSEVIAPSTAQPTSAQPKNSVSVKDRAKHLNKMTSDTDLHNVSKVSATDSQGRSYEDSSSVVSMDAAQRDWMITTATAEYHAINKLLLQNPQFVRRKDFVTTALHWAAKHGQAEVVKLLCGQPGAQNIVNIQSGYTPLHVASMHGHEEIITLLVKVYDADPNIRDYSGKMPKHYMRNCSSTTARARRPKAAGRGSSGSGNRTTGGNGFKRQPSISAKSQRFGFYGIPGGAALANSWGGNTVNGPSRSPSPSPQTSPKNTRKSSSTWRSPLPSPIATTPPGFRKESIHLEVPGATKSGDGEKNLLGSRSLSTSLQNLIHPKGSRSLSSSPHLSPWASPATTRKSSVRASFMGSRKWMRKSASVTEGVIARALLSPFTSPASSPRNSRSSYPSSLQDENLMPPPKVAPKRKKKGRSDETKRASSDTEMDSHTVSDNPMPSSKSFFI